MFGQSASLLYLMGILFVKMISGVCGILSFVNMSMRQSSTQMRLVGALSKKSCILMNVRVSTFLIICDSIPPAYLSP